MVLNIVTEQIKETRFLSQVSRSYLSNLDGEPPSKIKGWTKNAENANGCLLWQKLIISASTLLRKPCLGSKLGYLRARIVAEHIKVAIVILFP